MATAEPTRMMLRDWVFLSEKRANGEVRCVAGVGSQSGDFRLLFNTDGSILLRFSIKEMRLRKGLFTIALQVDDQPPWTFSETTGEETVLFMTLPGDVNGQEILREILDGRQLKLLDNLGLSVITFSLLGSGTALQKMLTCES